MGIECWWEGSNTNTDYERGYENGYNRGKEHGKEELIDELNNYLSNLSKNNTVVDIETIKQVIESYKEK